MTKASRTPALPPGSDRVAAWAARARAVYQPHPADEWFRAWEPYDTMISGAAYFNSVSFAIPLGSVTIAEPWYAAVESEPLDRTLLGFVSHVGWKSHAAARGGEHFNTRVAYLESAPPPHVQLGDPSWDAHMTTFAASGAEAARAFPPSVRRKLMLWAFSGHIEVRPGGLVCHFAGYAPVPEAYERLQRGLPELVASWFSK